MKKQLHKIKIAAENFSRSSKSETSSDDLLKADKQVERVKDVLEKVSKKFSANAVSSAPVHQTEEQDSAAREKRIKKVHEYRLAVAIDESLKQGDLPKSVLRDVLENCDRLEREIANEIINNEIDVENDVTRRLVSVQEKQLSVIQKQKRTVTKLQQDTESARNKYSSARKLAESATKVNQLKEELDDCESRLEKERDAWAAEMFEFMAEEETIASNILNYVRFQQIYYKKALERIDRVMMDMDELLRNNNGRIFKVPLLDHLKKSKRSISYVIELCVCALLERGMNEEGLLRVGCASSKLRRMRSALDANVVTTPLPSEYQDVHVIAGVLKAYLRDLPDPLLTYNLYGEFVAAVQRSNEAQRKTAILNAVNKLPEGHYYNLRYLTRFLHLLASKSDRNKMSTQNIAIVMSPNLLWAPNHGDSQYGDYSSVNAIVETLVGDWDFFFEGEVKFYVNFSKDEMFRETGATGGQPLDRDASTATIGDSSGIMCKSVTTNGQTTATGVSYMQPMPSMTQSFMAGPHTSLDNFRHSHSRSSSHDTSLILLSSESGAALVKHSQSNSSLSDHSSPPLTDSPKLPVRKKYNKSAAPTPPSQQQLQGVGSKIPQDNKDAVRTSLNERLGAVESSLNNKPEKPPRPAVGPTTECHTLNRHRSKPQSVSGGALPVALPRTTLVRGEGATGASSLSNSREVLKSSDDEDDRGQTQSSPQPHSLVSLRENRMSMHEKPAIPERPASLMRSNFFKGSLQEVNSLPMVDSHQGSTASLSAAASLKKTQSFRDANGQTPRTSAKDSNNNHNNNSNNGGNGQTMLERAHIFNVDKQQVAFIDVGNGEGPALRAAPIAEAESNAITTPTEPPVSVGAESSVGSLLVQPPSPRSAVDPKGMVIKRPQVPAPPPPKNHRPKSQDSVGAGSDTEVTGL